MGHYKDEQWYKDMTLALSSFTDEYLKSETSGNIRRRTYGIEVSKNWANIGNKKACEIKYKGFCQPIGNVENSRKGGNINKESGHISSLGKEWGRHNMIEHVNKRSVCEHCGEETNIGNIERYHTNGKCLEKIKNELEIYNRYKTSGLSMSKLSKEFGISASTICNLVKKYNSKNK
jgi:hypothetical protein